MSSTSGKPIDPRLSKARDLIKAKRYDEARKLLEKIGNDATAQRWLLKLDEMEMFSPTAAAPVPVTTAPKKVGCVRRVYQVVVYSLAGLLILIVVALWSRPSSNTSQTSSPAATQTPRVFRNETEEVQWMAEQILDPVSIIQVNANKIALRTDFGNSSDGTTLAAELSYLVLACKFKEEGFNGRDYSFVGYAKFVDNFGNFVTEEAVSLDLRASAVIKMDCSHMEYISLPEIAEEYYIHPSLR